MGTKEHLRIGSEYECFCDWIAYRAQELTISSVVDVESEKLHRVLFATKIIIIPLDIILARICPTLYLYDHEWLGTSIGKAMKMPLRDMTSLVRAEHPELLGMHEVWMT